jgi:FixJ family two-component response regulator
MGLVVSGMLNKQIASQTETSEITLNVHQARVMRKMEAGSLEAGSLGELVGMAERLQLFRLS